MSIKNPLFIPRSFIERKVIEKNRRGEAILYRTLSIDGIHLRVIKYYKVENWVAHLYRVNVWGICGELREFRDGFVAHDEEIDFKTRERLKGLVKALYPGETEIVFY